jgi:hypothetical protein
MILALTAAKSPSVWDQPGTPAFLVVFGMGVILYFVFRSLVKHLRKINDAARLEAARLEDQPDGAAKSSAQFGGLEPGSDDRALSDRGKADRGLADRG